jgi:hypothetical protein
MSTLRKFWLPLCRFGANGLCEIERGGPKAALDCFVASLLAMTKKKKSHIQRRLVGEFGALLDEVEARFSFGAHQPLDGFLGVLAIVGGQHDA